MARNYLLDYWLCRPFFLYFFFPSPASLVFDTKLQVCIQRIASGLFYDVHIVCLLFLIPPVDGLFSGVASSLLKAARYLSLVISLLSSGAGSYSWDGT